MAEVDVSDDGIRRFVVRHYRYDPVRRERRHVVVAAYDNEREYAARLDAVDAEIRSRREAGHAVDLAEYVSGIVREPGDDQLAANGRLLSNAFKHGVTPGPWLNELELPQNVGVLSAGAPVGPGLKSRARRGITRWRLRRRR